MIAHDAVTIILRRGAITFRGAAFGAAFVISRTVSWFGAVVAGIARAALFAGAGVLRRDDLIAMSRDAWRDFNASDLEISAGLLGWERDVYAQYLRAGDRILVVGAGNGRDLLALAECGHEVVGLEPSAEAVARAHETLARHGHASELVRGFVENANIPGMFNVVIFSYCTYSYIPGRAHRIAALQRVRDALAPGGRVIVTYLGATRIMTGRSAALARLTARLTGSDWSAEPHDVLVPSWKERPLVQFEHRFTVEEADAEARAAGFAVSYHRMLPDAPTMVLTPR